MTNKKELKKAAKNSYKWLIGSIGYYRQAKAERGKRECAYEIEHHLQTLNLLRNALAER